MRIEKMKRLRNGKYQLKLSNHETVTTHDEVILKHNLLFSREITTELLNELYKDTKYYDIYQKAVKYIATRMRSTHEMKQYLEKYQIEESVTEQIIEQLNKNGLLNDAHFARAYIADKTHLSNMGPYQIKKDLVEHHISNETIEMELEKLDDHFIQEKVDKLILKKISANKNHSTRHLKEKVVYDLYQKGFSKEMVLESFERQCKQDNQAIEKEYQKIYSKLSKKYEGTELLFKVKQKLYQKGFQTDEINAKFGEL